MERTTAGGGEGGTPRTRVHSPNPQTEGTGHSGIDLVCCYLLSYFICEMNVRLLSLFIGGESGDGAVLQGGRAMPTAWGS